MNHRQDSGCPKCGGSTKVLQEGTNLAIDCDCRALTIKRNRSRQLFTRLPRFYAESTGFDRNPVRDLEPAVLKKLRAYARKLPEHLDEGRGLWFEGPNGNGKTSAAVTIGREALERHERSVSFQSVPTLLSRIRDTYNTDDGRVRTTYLEFMQQLHAIDLLILDDLGAQNDKPWVMEQFYVLVNERMLAKRAVIVTTNDSIEELGPQVGRRVTSRLLEICGEPIQFTGFDWRPVIGREKTLELEADASALFPSPESVA